MIAIGQNIETRPYTPMDYPVLASWYVGRGMQAIHADALPTDGVLVLRNGEPVACAFVYFTSNSLWAMIGWIAGNPEFGGKALRECICAAIRALKVEAKRRGYVYVWAFPQPMGLAKQFQREGFCVADRIATSMVAHLGMESQEVGARKEGVTAHG